MRERICYVFYFFIIFFIVFSVDFCRGEDRNKSNRKNNINIINKQNEVKKRSSFLIFLTKNLPYLLGGFQQEKPGASYFTVKFKVLFPEYNILPGNLDEIMIISEDKILIDKIIVNNNLIQINKKDVIFVLNEFYNFYDNEVYSLRIIGTIDHRFRFSVVSLQDNDYKNLKNGLAEIKSLNVDNCSKFFLLWVFFKELETYLGKSININKNYYLNKYKLLFKINNCNVDQICDELNKLEIENGCQKQDIL